MKFKQTNQFNQWTLALARWNWRSQRADFYEDLADSLSQKELSLRSTLMSRLEAARKRKNQSRSRLIASWLARMGLDNDDKTNALHQSATLSYGLTGSAPVEDLALLRAAEKSNQLTAGLRLLAKICSSLDRMKSQIRGAVIYPSFVALIAIALYIMYAVFIQPLLQEIAPLESYSSISTLYMIFMGKVFLKYGLITLAISSAVIFTFFRSLSRWSGPTRSKWDAALLPPYRVYRNFQGGRTMVNLAMLMSVGMGFKEAIEEQMRYSSPWLRWHMQTMLRRYEQRPSDWQYYLGSGWLSADLVDRIGEIAKSTDIGTAFQRIGVQQIERVEKANQKTSSSLKYTLIGIAAVLIIGYAINSSLSMKEMQDRAEEVSRGEKVVKSI